MKKIFIILCLNISFLVASGIKLSPISPAYNIFIDLETSSCNNECLDKLYEKEFFFSFLSRIRLNTADIENQERFKKLMAIIQSSVKTDENLVKIAVLLPQKNIHRFAISTVNSIYAYLFLRNVNFKVEVFNSYDEQEESLKKMLDEIMLKNYKFVIAPLTNKGVNFINSYNSSLLIFIPTLNKSSVFSENQNVFFGGIDYEEQVKKLLEISASKVAIFSDGSELGAGLDMMIRKNAQMISYENQIVGSKFNLKPMLKSNFRLNNASIFLNMPLVKSSLLASQIRAYELNPFNILSTQINYHPMLLTLTQYLDRKNMYIANSISKSTPQLVIANELLGNDIEYDWVNYAVNLGMDFFYTNFINTATTPLFEERMINNQIEYQINIIKPSIYKFELYMPSEEVY